MQKRKEPIHRYKHANRQFDVKLHVLHHESMRKNTCDVLIISHTTFTGFDYLQFCLARNGLKLEALQLNAYCPQEQNYEYL